MQPTHPQNQKWDPPIKGIEVNEFEIKEHAQERQTNPNPENKNSQSIHKNNQTAKGSPPSEMQTTITSNLETEVVPIWFLSGVSMSAS